MKQRTIYFYLQYYRVSHIKVPIPYFATITDHDVLLLRHHNIGMRYTDATGRDRVFILRSTAQCFFNQLRQMGYKIKVIRGWPSYKEWQQ
jgi:hypothetical protein